jgi:hypothetical protein
MWGGEGGGGAGGSPHSHARLDLSAGPEPLVLRGREIVPTAAIYIYADQLTHRCVCQHLAPSC